VIGTLLILVGVAIIAVMALVGAPHFFRGAPVSRVLELDGSENFVVATPGFARAAEIAARTRLEPGATIEVLDNGALFPRLWEDLRAARHSITIVQYYAGPGEVTDTLAQILTAKARAGVPVWYVYDPIGSSDLPASWFDGLRAAGVNVAEFRPLRWYRLDRVNHRTHVRAVVIDGAIGYTGGCGFDDKWLGDGRTANHWRDTNARIVGRPVHQLQAVFIMHWTEATGELLVGERLFVATASMQQTAPASNVHEAVDPARTTLMAVMASPASVGSSNAERLLALSLAAAQHTLWIANSYFVPDGDFVRMLCDAAAEGADVRVLTNGRRTDVKATLYAGRRRYESLLQGGVRIFEYQPTVLHSKTLVVDSEWSIISTVNFDNRSLAYNDEVALLVLDRDLGERMQQAFLEDTKYAREIALEEFRRRGLRLRLLERFADLVWRWL
jgi:cardiolipin synthase